MTTISLFPFSEYWWFYLAFSGFVLLLLSLDLGVFHRKAHEVSFKESAIWSGVWISLALIFNLVLHQYAEWKFAHDPRLLAYPGFDPAAAADQTGLEFLTGFIIEKALAVDNIFVFIAIFGYFGIPRLYQHKILFYGIIGALAFRAAFIAISASLLQYHWVLILFGVFLVFTGIKIIFVPDHAPDPEKNPVIRLTKRFLPITHTIEGGRFFLRVNGLLRATPLFLALILVEVSDIIFAIDSVPAIFAITKEPLIVFTSNIFAILGLRSLYFMLAGVMHKFAYLKHGLGLILIFVGVKMAYLNELMDGKFPISWSLGIIGVILGGSIILSLLKKDTSLAS